MSYLYLAKGELSNEWKIGRSKNPDKRIKQLPNFSLVHTHFVGTYENSVESELWVLRNLKQYCVRGNEWFVFPKGVNALKTFRMLCAKQMMRLGVEKVEKEVRYLKYLSEGIDDIKGRLMKQKTIPQYVCKRALNNIKYLVDECGYSESTFDVENEVLLKAIERVSPDRNKKDLTISPDNIGLYGLHVSMKGLYHRELERLKGSSNDTTRCYRKLSAYRKALEIKCAYPRSYFSDDDKWLEAELTMFTS